MEWGAAPSTTLSHFRSQPIDFFWGLKEISWMTNDKCHQLGSSSLLILFFSSSFHEWVKKPWYKQASWKWWVWMINYMRVVFGVFIVVVGVVSLMSMWWQLLVEASTAEMAGRKAHLIDSGVMVSWIEFNGVILARFFRRWLEWMGKGGSLAIKLLLCFILRRLLCQGVETTNNSSYRYCSKKSSSVCHRASNHRQWIKT